MKVKNYRGDEIELTKDEVRFLRAVKRLEKLNSGRIYLFGNGSLTARYGGLSHYRIIQSFNIQCEGGDGGDNFD